MTSIAINKDFYNFVDDKERKKTILVNLRGIENVFDKAAIYVKFWLF